LNEHLKNHLQSIPNHSVADADTVLKVLKSLKTEKEEIKTNKGTSYEINKHDNLNILNIKILKELNLLEKTKFLCYTNNNTIFIRNAQSFNIKIGYP